MKTKNLEQFDCLAPQMLADIFGGGSKSILLGESIDRPLSFEIRKPGHTLPVDPKIYV